MECVAHALGWPISIYKLDFAKASNAAIAVRPLSYLLKGSIVELVALAPQLVLCAEASACAVAVHAKRAGAKFKLVCIGRPRGSFDIFDLIVTFPQYRLKPAPNVVELPVGPHEVPALTEVDQSLVAKLESTSKPVLAVFVGGTSPPDLLDGQAARQLAEIANTQTATHAVHVVTSPRTGPEAGAALAAALSSEITLHPWDQSPGAASPYRALLARAETFIVTSDSVSMVAETLMTGKPVWLHNLPMRRRLGPSIVRHIRGWPVADRLFDSGLIEERPDRAALFQTWALQFGLGLDKPGHPTQALPQTAPIIAKAIRQLF